MQRNLAILDAAAFALLVMGCSTPAKIEVSPENVVFDKAGKSLLLQAKVLDAEGREMSTKGLELGWLCEDTSVVSLSQDGVVTSVASGEAEVTVEVAGTDVRKTVTVEVKIPSEVRVSIDKLRLWEGEKRDDVFADVRTERGAVIPGLRPSFASENSDVVRVEPLPDNGRPNANVRLTGISSGAARVTARYENLAEDIKVTVFAEGEDVQMVGNHISKKKERDARRGEKKKEKALKYDF